MVAVYKLPVEKDIRNPNLRYESFFDARDDLVDFGTDATRALFKAAHIAFSVNYSSAAANPVEHDRVFLETLSNIRYGKIVLAGETDNVDDIAAVGVYSRPSMGPRRNVAELEHLAVLPDYQRKGLGLGSAILQYVETELTHEGATTLQLIPSHTAVAFYEKYGYLPKGGTGPKMTKDLSAV
ncbi:MAG: Acetyltransferase domain [Candidatus Saccharibacteria bacterium]|jgi:GNAT superfamily N-acetyltransferase|nr:Acetyltransferase domain [Candidatus Saccharibacteria bacterium]